MAAGWVRSLHCKSNAMDDVSHPKNPFPKKALLPLSSCGGASRDVVLLFTKYPPPPKKPPPAPSQTLGKPKKKSNRRSKPKPPVPLSPAGPPPPSGPIPTLAELPSGHSSRRVVEIIFSSGWTGPGPAEIEMLFRVRHPARAAARFEEFRAAVRARSGGDARCAADGNEMMRFHCAAPSGGAGEVYGAGVARSAVALPRGGVAEGIRTFEGSGGAHVCGGGGSGRRAMLVCRVIAGRVRGESDPESAGESVSVAKGEVLVLDSRAVLPCFLIIYKV